MHASGRLGRPARAWTGALRVSAGRGVLLRDTLTLEVRVRLVGRYVAERDTSAVETEHGTIRVKRNWLAGEVVSAAA